MNISEPFIRRPVATTLVMAAIAAVRRRRLPRRCRSATCRTSTSRPCSVTASLPGASPETMASAVATPLERQFSTIAGARLDDLDQRARHARRSRCSSTSTATSTPPRRTCRPPSRRPRALLPPGMPTPPSFRKVNPADQPILFLALTSPTLPLSDARRVRRDAAWRSASRWCSGVAQVQVFGAQKYAVRVQVDPHALAVARHRHRRGRDAPSSSANVNLPTGTLYGPRPALHRPGHRPADRRRRVPAARSSPTATARRCGWRRSATRHRQRRERQDRRLVRHRRAAQRAIMLAIQRQPGTNTVEVADARQGAAAGVRRRSCRRRSSWTCCTTARETIRESVHDVQVHAAADARPGGAGDLPVPAQRLGHDHPQPRAADLDHRHLRRDVPARLQPRQPVADGADARRSASSSTTPS